MQKFPPGSTDYHDLEDQLAAVKRRIERGREVAEKDLARRQAREAAMLLEDIQGAIADVAKARGFDYVVRADAGPDPDADHLQVLTAMKRSVLYANPRNDITDEVIRELNRRFEAAGDKAPR